MTQFSPGFKLFKSINVDSKTSMIVDDRISTMDKKGGKLFVIVDIGAQSSFSSLIQHAGVLKMSNLSPNRSDPRKKNL